MMCAATVTLGGASGPPHLREMPARMPRGSAHMPADAQYYGVENCRAAKDSGCRPAVEPRSNYEIEGGDAGAEMFRFPGERPGVFRKLLRKRNSVKDVFSPVKEGLGGAARAAGAKTQTVELPSTCTCRNMVFA